VIARRRRTRSNSWHSSQTPVSTTITAISTDDPLLSVLTAPVGTLHLVFGGTANGAITLASALAPKAPAPPYPPSHTVKPLPVSAASHDCIDQRAEAAAHPQRIELSIDSLPSYLLIEPIPVIIDPVGDAAYTAWVRNLDANATGQSVFEALLMLKERIASVYEELNGRTHLTSEQRATLQMLHTYIAPKKLDWV
jgi:hypothetical protein